MQCADVAERLLVDDLGSDPELDRHVADCPRCTHTARKIAHLDAVLGSALVVVPPIELQQRLAQLAVEAARPRPAPWWTWLSHLNLAELLAQRPQMAAAQGIAAVLLALSSWQIFGLLSALHPVVGDVGYAMELVAASPAVVYLGGLQIDLQSLGFWSVVGILGWLVSEDGLIGRRIASSGLRLP